MQHVQMTIGNNACDVMGRFVIGVSPSADSGVEGMYITCCARRAHITELQPADQPADRASCNTYVAHLRMHAGMCRAHGIAHQRVTERASLQGALKAAWRLNTHSVVEVITPPGSANVEHHRRIQDSVRRAVLRALQPVRPLTGSPCQARRVRRPPALLSFILHCMC